MMIYAVAGGALMEKPYNEAYELLEEMTSNDFQWQEKKVMEKGCGYARTQCYHSNASSTHIIKEIIENLQCKYHTNQTSTF